jgi:hypothetical protein
MIVYNTKEQAKMKLRGMSIPFGSSILLDTLEGQILGVQGHEEINFLSMDSLPPSNGKVDQILKLDKNGNVIWADDDVRTIIDNLDSVLTDAALSANMGRELNSLKLDNSLIANINILTGSEIVTSTGALQIQHSFRTYNKSSNTFPRNTQVFTIPEANADCNGLLSINHYKLLANIVTNANTTSNGIIHNLLDFTYTAEVVQHRSSTLYYTGSNWSTQAKYHTIKAATQTTAGVMSAADKTKLDNTVSATTVATPDTLGLVKQAAELTNLEADNDLAGVIAHFNQLLANLKEAGIMYATPAGS